MTVTKAQLDKLRAERPTLKKTIRYTPDETTVAFVHSSIEAERIGQLNKGDKILQHSHEKLKTDLESARKQGWERQQFNAHSHTHGFNP